MAINPVLGEYETAKRRYHNAGKACKGTAPDSPERRAYEAAKVAYREAGRRLRESRAK